MHRKSQSFNRIQIRSRNSQKLKCRDFETEVDLFCERGDGGLRVLITSGGPRDASRELRAEKAAVTCYSPVVSAFCSGALFLVPRHRKFLRVQMWFRPDICVLQLLPVPVSGAKAVGRALRVYSQAEGNLSIINHSGSREEYLFKNRVTTKGLTQERERFCLA